jgi:hypothetical protein
MESRLSEYKRSSNNTQGLRQRAAHQSFRSLIAMREQRRNGGRLLAEGPFLSGAAMSEDHEKPPSCDLLKAPTPLLERLLMEALNQHDYWEERWVAIDRELQRRDEMGGLEEPVVGLLRPT